ncbi:deoxyhypusine hydroxylase-like [Styela clava]
MEDKLKRAGALLNDNNKSLAKRFRALFMLKGIGGDQAVNYIAECFKDSSALLKHELAYCLGQMQNKKAIPVLISVLEDTLQEAMVRHEAGEALGAIGDESALKTLEKYVNDPTPEVAETCILAVDRIKWLKQRRQEVLYESPYESVDPAPSGVKNNEDINSIKNKLVNMTLPLFERYKAMFSLRNIGTEEAATALAEGLNCTDSALFRHEIAYVLGQMQLPNVVPQLNASLKDSNENCMVRHECAEALGSIADETCLNILKSYLSDPDDVVRESCEVALDMYDYERSSEFQYAISDAD